MRVQIKQCWTQRSLRKQPSFFAPLPDWRNAKRRHSRREAKKNGCFRRLEETKLFVNSLERLTESRLEQIGARESFTLTRMAVVTIGFFPAFSLIFQTVRDTFFCPVLQEWRFDLPDRLIRFKFLNRSRFLSDFTAMPFTIRLNLR